MIKIKLELIYLSILFIFSSFLFTPFASADGGMVIYDPIVSSWDLKDIDQQVCAINYENGIENMILSINVENLDGEKAVWIFPVPAKPDKIVIDIIKDFPTFWGYNVKDEANEKFSSALLLMQLSQIYPFPFFIGGNIFFRSMSMGRDAGIGYPLSTEGGLTIGVSGGVRIYEHVEKMGLTTELITSEKGDALYDYLKEKELEIPPSFKSILEEYIGQDYSFVISWIPDIEEFKKGQEQAYFMEMVEKWGNPNEIISLIEYSINRAKTEKEEFETEKEKFERTLKRFNYLLDRYEIIKNPEGDWENWDEYSEPIKKEFKRYLEYFMDNKYSIGLYITFPTDEIYFPLKLTGVYEDLEIPILICVMGYITPELYPEIKDTALAGISHYTKTKERQVNYFFGKNYHVPEELSSFFNDQTEIENFEYTVIKINKPSKYLTEDLWMKNSVPFSVTLANFISKYTLILGIILFIFISCLASLFSGMIIFRKDKPSKKKFILFGLWNFLTLMGLSIASYSTEIDNKFTQNKEVVQRKVSYGKVVKKSLTIGLIIMTLPVFIIFAIISYNVDSIDSFKYFISDFFSSPVLLFFLITYLFLCAFITPFLWGYYNNRKIMKFIILFSLLFLVISFTSWILLSSIF